MLQMVLGWLFFYKKPYAYDSFIVVSFWPEVDYEVLGSFGAETHKGRLRVEYRSDWIETEKWTEAERPGDGERDVTH